MTVESKVSKVYFFTTQVEFMIATSQHITILKVVQNILSY